MLGDTLTMTLDGSGGTAIVMPKINQDGYTSEYFVDVGGATYRAKVRHSNDNVKSGSQAYARHSVTFEKYIKPSTTYPNGSRTEVTFTIRMDPLMAAEEVIDLSEAVSFYMTKAGGIAAKLLGWES